MALQISKQLSEFIIKQRWKYDFPLTEEKTLNHDLEIYGDDAVDFFLALSKEFNVDVSNFEIRKYFKGEGYSLKNIFKMLKGKTEEKYLPITLGDLERAIAAGKLDDNVIRGID